MPCRHLSLRCQNQMHEQKALNQTLQYRRDITMKKSKVILLLLAVIAIGAAMFALFRVLSKNREKNKQDELSDDDLDFIDEDIMEESELGAKDTRIFRTGKKRRGYIPLKFHKKENFS